MAQTFNKKLYTGRQLYSFIEENLRSLKSKNNAKKLGLIDEAFMTRLKLVVTEVNGCELCSYGHTEIALKDGVAAEDIKSMLSGVLKGVVEDESIALYFAQHYADNNGKPTVESWNRLVETYSEKKALGILGTIRGIMIGNTIGIALGAFKSRLSGKPLAKTSLSYELMILVSFLPSFITAAITGGIKSILGKPLIQFA